MRTIAVLDAPTDLDGLGRLVRDDVAEREQLAGPDPRATAMLVLDLGEMRGLRPSAAARAIVVALVRGLR